MVEGNSPNSKAAMPQVQQLCIKTKRVVAQDQTNWRKWKHGSLRNTSSKNFPLSTSSGALENRIKHDY